MAERIRENLVEASRVMGSIDPEAVARAVMAVSSARDAGGKVLAAGDGGSALTASHFVLDLQKAACHGGKGTRAVSLSESIGLVTAWANDVRFDSVFAEQLRVVGDPVDALVVFSVSGSSPNLVTAVNLAHEMGLTTVGLLGKDGGSLRTLVDHAVVVPHDDYGWVESAHLVLEHVFTYALRDEVRLP